MDRLSKAVVAMVLIAGLSFCILSVKRDHEIFDADEAAWIFNGYYLDLYLSGDWKSPKWTEFDKFAQHPPATSYLIGAVLHAVDRPMKSVEPRRYWFENDFKIIFSYDEFKRELERRISYKQLMAVRYMSAFFAWLAAVGLMFLAFRVIGVWGGIAGFVLLIAHPTYAGVATLAVGDTFMIFLSVFSVLCAVAIARAEDDIKKRGLFYSALIAVSLGILFSSKINSFALIVPVLFFPLIIARNRKRTFGFILASVVFAFGIAYLLDPALHGSFIAKTMERISWRAQRVDIQRIVFSDQAMKGLSDRLAFAAYYLFFSKPWAVALGLMTMFGFVSLFFIRGKGREKAFILANVAYFGILTIACLPMAWTRYAIAYMPFLLLPACAGAEVFFYMARKRERFTTSRGKELVTAGVVFAVVFMLARSYFMPMSRHMPRLATPFERDVSRAFALSLMNPGQYEDIHRYLLNYFTSTDNAKWVDYEQNILQSIKKRQK